jgi:hypothetical protein
MTYDPESKDYVCDTSKSDPSDKRDASSNSESSSSGEISDCIPDSSEFTLGISDLSDQSNNTKRSCNARGYIRNEGTRDIMFAVYRVNHYGAEEHFGEKWMGRGYKILKAGESAEYGRFHRCTGGNCGEGEWFYIEKISVLYYTPECSQLVSEQKEKSPESIHPIKNPCDW